MFQDVLAAIPLGIILAFLFGPVFFVLLETAAIKGSRVAIIFDVGVILSDAVFLVIAYFSTNKLLERIKDDPGLFIFGGCLLTAYAVVSIIRQKQKIYTLRPKSIKKIKKLDWIELFLKGFLLNFVNIGVLGFWLGVIVAFGPTMDMNPQRLFVFFSTVLITYFIVDLIKIFLAEKLENKLTPRRVFRLKRTISIIILLCGIGLIVRGVFPTPMKKIQNQVETVVPETKEVQQK